MAAVQNNNAVGVVGQQGLLPGHWLFRTRWYEAELIDAVVFSAR